MNDLRMKIGQLLIMGFDGHTLSEASQVVEEILHQHIGGVILFDYHYQRERYDKNIKNPEQVRRLTADLHRLNQRANFLHHRPDLPLIIAVDYEGGAVNRLKVDYGFPPTISAAQASQLPFAEVEQVALKMAHTLRDYGFNLNFVPMLDVNVNPNNPIVGCLDRSFSADPEQVVKYAAVYVQALLNAGVQCAYKHFPGHGSSTRDSHLGFVDVTDTWQDYELIPYRRLLPNRQAWGMVMTAHIINCNLDPSGLPATLSYPILTGLLRQQMHFDGIIISDDMQMKAISDHFGQEQAITLALNAGVDMFIFGNQLAPEPQLAESIIDHIYAEVAAGHIAQERIEESYQRVQKFKQGLHIMESRL